MIGGRFNSEACEVRKIMKAYLNTGVFVPKMKGQEKVRGWVRKGRPLHYVRWTVAHSL